MSKKFKRILATITVLSMMFSAMPMTMAEEDEGTPAVTESAPEQNEAPKAEEPKAEAPKTEEPKAAPKEEAPKSEPKVEVKEEVQKDEPTGENLTVTTTTTTDDNGKGKVTVTIEKEWTNESKSEEAPKTEEPSESEEAPVTEKPSESEEAPVTEEPSESEEAPKTEEPSESEEAPKTEEPAETEEPEGSDIVINGEETTVITETSAKTTTKVEGTETREWTEEDNGDEAGQPEVEVELIPGESTTGTAESTEITGDQPTGKNDGNYDYTETTVVDRTVDATTSEGEITVDTSGEGDYNPIQTDKSLIEDFDNQLHTHSNTSYKQTAAANQATLDKQPEEGGYDFLFIGQGQMSDFYVGTVTPADGEEAHSGALQFELMQNPEIANGKFVKETDENGVVNDKDLFTAYCCDLVTGAVAGTWYKMDNLEDAGYYDEEAAAHIRSIVSSGYWGTNPGEDAQNPATGSLEKLKKEMMAMAEQLGLTEDDINAITPGQALAATQAAIWKHANETTEGQIVDEDGRLIIPGYKRYTDASVAIPDEYDYKLAAAVYNYLLGLEPTAKTESTEIIDKDSFIKEDSMSLSVGDKTTNRKENKDEDKHNDVYDVAVNFALVVTVTENDDLIVQVVTTDENGNTVVAAKGRIAGDGSNDEGFNDVAYDAATGMYSLKGLTLAENSDFNFDLELSGTQYLEEGVYIFTAAGGVGSSQTFVGLAEGHKEVGVSQSFTVNFDVDETDYVKTTRKWKSTNTQNHNNGGNTTPSQPQINLVIRQNPTTVETTSISEEAVPLSGELEIIVDEEVPMEDGLVEILDEEVPLAAVPQTGDGSAMMAMMSLLSLLGIILLSKKREFVR